MGGIGVVVVTKQFAAIDEIDVFIVGCRAEEGMKLVACTNHTLRLVEGGTEASACFSAMTYLMHRGLRFPNAYFLCYSFRWYCQAVDEVQRVIVELHEGLAVGHEADALAQLIVVDVCPCIDIGHLEADRLVWIEASAISEVEQSRHVVVYASLFVGIALWILDQ